MIPRAAVDAYLARKLDDFVWAKQLSPQQVERALSQLLPAPRLSAELRLHQKICVLLGIAHPQFCFFLDMGSGKTLLSLELLRYWTDAGRMRRALVFVTSDKAFSTWENQFKRFNIDLPVAALEGSSARKWQQLEEFGNGVVLLPYPGAVAMTSVRAPTLRGKVKLALDPQAVERLARNVDVVVFDESTKLGNQQSLTYKLAHRLTECVPIRYALTGRPFGRDPMMLWPQFNVIDRGETLGETIGLFRAAFFTESQSYWGRYAKEYKFKKSMQSKLSRIMQHRSITYSAEECIELPKVVAMVETLDLPEETRVYCSRLTQELIEARGNWREVKNVFLRLRQLSSGFVGLLDDETGEKASVVFKQNPKLDRLLELLDELPSDCKAVVFYAFTASGRLISERLAKSGYAPIWLWSGTKDSRKELAAFLANPSRRVAVVNNQLAAMSLDGLQRVANYDFFYESPVSVIDREQAERRLVRDGQQRTVFRYDFVVKRTADEKIRAFHREGGDLMRAVMRDPMLLVS